MSSPFCPAGSFIVNAVQQCLAGTILLGQQLSPAVENSLAVESSQSHSPSHGTSITECSSHRWAGSTFLSLLVYQLMLVCLIRLDLNYDMTSQPSNLDSFTKMFEFLVNEMRSNDRKMDNNRACRPQWGGWKRRQDGWAECWIRSWINILFLGSHCF